MLELYRHFYRGYFNECGFRGILETLPTYMIWDDHEILDNWGSDTSTDGYRQRLFPIAEQAYREYQHLHNPGAAVDDSAPYPFRFWYGDVGFLTLDIRSCRDYHRSRVIGDRQWELLRDFLGEATEQEVSTVFITCTVPVIHFPPSAVCMSDWLQGKKGENIRDRWDSTHFKQDRNRLLDVLFDWQAGQPRRQVVLLAGDIHAGAAFRVRRRRGRGQVLQWTSSSLTASTNLAHRLANRLGTVLVNWGEDHCQVVREGIELKNNFAVADVTPLGRGRCHELTFSLYGYDLKHRRLSSSVQIRSQPGA